MGIKLYVRDHGWKPSSVMLDLYPSGEPLIKDPAADLAREVLVVVTGYRPDDLVLAACVAGATNRAYGSARLLIPYLPAARDDRGWICTAETLTLLINAMRFSQVVAVDPHSDYMPDGINNFTRLMPSQILKVLVTDETPLAGYDGVITPDEGGRERAWTMANHLAVPVYRADKHRDFDTGKLSGFRMVDTLPAYGKFLVVDDICDGGGTFMGLAEATGLGPDRLDLFVTHGIFSGAADQLHKHYGRIFTTDSYPYKQRPLRNLTEIRLIPTIIAKDLV